MYMLCLILISVCAGTFLSADEMLSTIHSDPHHIHRHVSKWRSQLSISQKRHGSSDSCYRRSANLTSCSHGHTRGGCRSSSTATEARIAVFIANNTATNTDIVTEIGDDYHQRAIAASKGRYTNQTFAVFDTRSKAYFSASMGSHFVFPGPYIPGLAGHVGGWISTTNDVVLLPYIIGVNESLRGNKKYTYRVALDTDNPEQGESDSHWRLLASGNVALVLGNSSYYIDTPQGRFFGGTGVGYANYLQGNLDCRSWNTNDEDCAVNNLILPPSVSFQIGNTPYQAQFPNFQISMTPLLWENDCCERGTGSIVAYLAGPNMDFVGPFNKYQITTLILPNQC